MFFFWIFWRYWAARLISKANFAEIARNKRRQAAYEIFSIANRFPPFKSRLFRFKKICAWGHQRAVPLKFVILPLLVSLSWKRLQIDMGLLFITTSIIDELFSRINIDDFERPWTLKIKGFIIFAIIGCSANFKSIATKWLKIDQDNLRTETAIGFRASSEH